MFFEEDNNNDKEPVHHLFALGCFTFVVATVFLFLSFVYSNAGTIVARVSSLTQVAEVSQVIIKTPAEMVSEANFVFPTDESVVSTCPWIKTLTTTVTNAVAKKVNTVDISFNKKNEQNSNKVVDLQGRITKKQESESASLMKYVDRLLPRATDDVSKQIILAYKTSSQQAIDDKKTLLSNAVTAYEQSFTSTIESALTGNMDYWQSYVDSVKELITLTASKCATLSGNTSGISAEKKLFVSGLSLKSKEYTNSVSALKKEVSKELTLHGKQFSATSREVQSNFRDSSKLRSSAFKTALNSASIAAKNSENPTLSEGVQMVAGPTTLSSNPCYVAWVVREERVDWKTDIHFDPVSFETFQEEEFPLNQYNADLGSPFYVTVLNGSGSTLAKYPLYSSRFLISESFSGESITGSMIQSPAGESLVLIPIFNGNISTLRIYDYQNKLLHTSNVSGMLNCNPPKDVPISSIISMSPQPKTVLKSAATFSWNAVDGATSYQFRIGKMVGKGEIKTADLGLTRHIYVSGLPIDGSTLYVRVLYTVGGTTKWQDFTYTAVGQAEAASTNNL